MEWIEASNRLPDKAGSYFCFDKVHNCKKLLWYNCKNTRSHLIHKPNRYLWLDEELNKYADMEKQVVELLSISGSHNICQIIDYFKKIKR